MVDTFRFFGHNLPYAQQIRPNTEGVPDNNVGERTIEIPIAKLWLKQFAPKDVVEVGATMSWCMNMQELGRAHDPVSVLHTVVDPWDAYTESVRQDAENYSYEGKYVLSVSTLEHVGLLEYQNWKLDLEKAYRVLTKIMSEAKGYLVDWPIGHNPGLDDAFRKKYETEGGFQVFYFAQINPDNRWEETEIDWRARYRYPYRHANGVIFVTDNLKWVMRD